MQKYSTTPYRCDPQLHKSVIVCVAIDGHSGRHTRVVCQKFDKAFCYVWQSVSYQKPSSSETKKLI